MQRFRTKREASHCPECGCKTLPWFEKQDSPFHKQWAARKCSVHSGAKELDMLFREMYKPVTEEQIINTFSDFGVLLGIIKKGKR
jgi:hypothetical protein